MATPSDDRRPAVLDPDRLLDALGGDVDDVRAVIDVFATQRSELLARLREAIDGADAVAVERAAHSFKGALATLGADAAARAAFRLERLGRGGDLGPVRAALASLEGELARLQRELDRLTA